MQDIQTLKQLIDSAVPVQHALEDNDRMTARLDMYYEKNNEEPTYVSCVMEDLISPTEEEPYQRKLKIDESWNVLDVGWIERVGYILIRNTGRVFTVHPSDEVKEAEKKKSIFVRCGDGDGDWEIPPKGFLIVKPTDVSKVELRCGLEETTIHISIFPG